MICWPLCLQSEVAVALLPGDYLPVLRHPEAHLDRHFGELSRSIFAPLHASR